MDRRMLVGLRLLPPTVPRCFSVALLGLCPLCQIPSLSVSVFCSRDILLSQHLSLLREARSRLEQTLFVSLR